MNKLLAKLGPFKWSLHNLVAHPLSEAIFIAGYCVGKRERAERIGNWIHDKTIPVHKRGTGRG